MEKYQAMVNNPEKVNADSEMARLRLTEPIHDSFENQYQQPFFMGYNLNLVEHEAWRHSTTTSVYASTPS